MEPWRDLSDYVEEPLSDAASCHEHISDLNGLPSDEAASPGYDSTGVAPLSLMGALNTEAVQSVFPCQLNASGICIHESICPTESVSGLGVVDMPDDSSDSSDCSIEHKSLIDSNGHIQDNRKTTVNSSVALTPVISSTVSDNSSSTKYTATADPLRPLSALSDNLSDISAVTEPLPDLYIFESESETWEFVPRRQVDPFSEVGTAVAPAHEGKLGSASDANQDSAEVGVADGQSDSPSELWLDTCQYLPWQDTGSRGDWIQASLDDRGHSQMEEVVWVSGDSSLPPEVTGVSDCLPVDDDMIGWSSGDTFERWSSVDSWASALSDWAAIIAAPPGDISAAFTAIGAEIDALTQALAESAVDRQQDTDRQQSHLQQDTDRQQSHLQQDTDRQQSHLQQYTDRQQSHPQHDTDRQQSHPQQDTDRQQSHPQQDTDRQQSHPQQDTDRQQSHPQQDTDRQQSHLQQDTDRQQSHLQQDTDRQQSHLQQYTDRQQSHLQQTHMLMAIWDQPLKPQSSIESLPGSSLSDPAEPSGTQTEEAHRTAAIPQDGVKAVEIRSTSGERCLLSTASETALCPAISDCPGETPLLPSSAVGDGMPTHQPHIAVSVGGMDTYLYTRTNHEELVLLHITEETQDWMKLEESFGDGWCQVTESPSVSQPGRSAKQGGERGFASSLSVSGFNRYQADALKFEVEGEGSEGSRPLTGLRDITPEDEPAHEPAEAASSALHRSAHKLKECDQPGQDELQCGVPPFIVPFAPLTITQPLLCQTNTTLEIRAERSVNDNCCHDVQPQELWPIFKGYDETPSESHEDKNLIHIKKSIATCAEEYLTDDCQEDLTLHTDQSSKNSLYDRVLHSEDNPQCFPSDTTTNAQEIQELSRELSNLVIVPLDPFLFSEKESIAYITLDLNDPIFLPRPITTKAIQSDQSADQPESNPNKASEMPHKKNTAECKSRSKKEKPSGFHHGGQASKKQDNGPHHTPTQQLSKIQDSHVSVGGALSQCSSWTGHEGKENGSMGVLGPTVVTERVTTQPLGKKKKKHSQNAAAVKSEAEPQAEEKSGATQKTARGKSDTLEPTLNTKAGKIKDKAPDIPIKNDLAQTQSSQKKAQLPVIKARQGTQPPCEGSPSELPSATQVNDDVIKRRRLSENKFGKMVSAFEAKLTKAEGPIQAKRVEHKAGTETLRKKAYSEVVKQKTHTHVAEPKVVQPIQSSSVSGDPQSLCLWCQFSAVSADNTVTWSREGTVLAEIKRSSGDESRVSVTIAKASHKDLGKYRCCLSSQHWSVTLDYVLTYEVLSEIVIPASSKPIPPALVEVEVEEEDVHFSRLLFREDFLSEQYFGENQPASIITEKAHFGEGMHRKAFRAKLQAGLVPKLSPGHPCVLKVHNSISYGTNNNEELVQKNFNLAVEECQVQNTAREYIKAYNNVARSAESFGEVPIIIPIYLVHRPSNDIPYATLEEELIGDFVKYSVRDGKEINLMRRDSEAGQKCCTFQHWVYQKTDGNLLVTDMQGVGMKLTDVGIATSKKGYKGFRGNCATSFIDQFKALHQCNMYCELLSLMSLQPKPKRPVGAPKPKTQCPAAPKKKTFGPNVKGKS